MASGGIVVIGGLLGAMSAWANLDLPWFATTHYVEQAIQHHASADDDRFDQVERITRRTLALTLAGTRLDLRRELEHLRELQAKDPGNRHIRLMIQQVEGEIRDVTSEIETLTQADRTTRFGPAVR